MLMLASADEVTVCGLIQTMAMCPLRRYPLNVDLEASAAALPGVADDCCACNEFEFRICRLEHAEIS
ncbi:MULTISPECIES: hypothetical protein [Burkholderia]|uniref:hypothetical protein n=1 Tax=Burkholderia TaxID=32008 RepID=UPI00158A6774|nr:MULTISPECIES: hypothetical protein [Burkholderia]